MRKVFILYENFYSPDGKKMSIGGIQTYIKLLIDVIRSNNMIPVVFQYANTNFVNTYNDVKVYGVAMKSGWRKKKKNQVLFKNCKRIFDINKDTIIFASETMSVKNNEKRVIGIQHGITWDVKGHEHFSRSKNMMFIFWRAFMAYKTAKLMHNVKVLVGVDYNFLNWYRTQVAYIEGDVVVIPNCTRIDSKFKNESDSINIIFARRFQKYRGTRLFASVARKILDKYENVRITFAGSGPDESYLKEMFQNDKNVKFMSYDSEHSLEVHKDYQIAVIPTIGSEGTSLSLLEAMASNCAVIATNVGGMTNIILDNYNGLLVNPEEKQLNVAIEELIENKEKREKLAEKGYETVAQAFSRELWQKKWTQVFEDYCVLEEYETKPVSINSRAFSTYK